MKQEQSEIKLEERQRRVGPYVSGKGREIVTEYWASYGGSASPLLAKTREAAEVEFSERREEIAAYWAADHRGMLAYSNRYGTAGE